MACIRAVRIGLERLALPFLAAILYAIGPPSAPAQEPGAVYGTVARALDAEPIEDATVTLGGSNRHTNTRSDGRYVLNRVLPGRYAIRFHALGYAAVEQTIEVTPASSLRLDIRLEAMPVQLGDITVEGASRTPESLLEAPSAVSIVTPSMARKAAVLGQIAQAFTTMPGVDVVQGDLHDFKVNTRGFNSPTARNVLVLQDGRDLSLPSLGLQQWATLSLPPDDLNIEFIRGPGSALYGAGGYAGVISITTPQARDVLGSRFRVQGGSRDTRQGDVRHAGLTAADRIGYRLNLGYSRSRAWTRSRTRFDRRDFIEEYAPATDSTIGPPPPAPDRTALNGQTTSPLTGEAVGDPEDLVSYYGSARFDWYADDGGIGTIDGGFARVKNSISVAGSGRVQIIDDLRPWTRLAWVAPRYFVSAWYSGRRTLDPVVLLNSGRTEEETSAVFQMEGQYRAALAGERLAVVTGASVRESRLDTKGTVLDPAEDDRRDQVFGFYLQGDYAVAPRFTLIGAVRFDTGDLFDAEVTPRIGLIFLPAEAHAIRLTVNRAFLPPSPTSLFVRRFVSTQDLSKLEDSLRGTSLAASLTAVPPGELFTRSGAVPVLSIGNSNLSSEKVTSLELGYKGQVARPVFTTVDLFFNRKTDFVTVLLPAPITNPSFRAWTAPAEVPEADRSVVEEAVRSALPTTQRGLTRLSDGSTAIVNSPGNAGLVYEWGIEVGTIAHLTEEISLSGSYSYYRFDVAQQQQGDVVEANTPRHKGTVTVDYGARNGLDAHVSGRFVDGFRWFSGVFRGYVPSSFTIDAGVGYRVTRQLRIDVAGTNLSNRRRFQIYGGSVEGRRIVGGVTVDF